MEQKTVFNYVYNSDLSTFVNVKIGTLDGRREKVSYQDILKNPLVHYSGRNTQCSPLVVKCELYSNGTYISLPIYTSYKSFTTRWSWNEWVQLPVRYCDLPRDVKLLLTIYDYEGPRKLVPVGGTTVSLFDNYGIYCRGLEDLRVWPGLVAHPDKTPGKGPLKDNKYDQMFRLNKLVKKYESGQMAQVDWLDRLVFREIEIVNDKEKKSSHFMYLMIEFPKPIYKDEIYHVLWWDPKSTPECYNINKFNKNGRVFDPEHGLENLHERKHHHLTRTLKSGIADRDLKPSLVNRENLYKIIDYPPTKQLTNAEQDLIWKYRYFLSNQKKGLPKFLKCVNWNLPKEGKQANDLLSEWIPVDAQDALELLGPQFTYPKVRRYAVERLSKANDDELLLYLLQLVQALKYEPLEIKAMNLLDVSHYSIHSDNSTDDTTTQSNITIIKDKTGNPESKLKDSLTASNSSIEMEHGDEEVKETCDLLMDNPLNESRNDLASFLIRRSCENNVLANYFYWYLSIECEEKLPDQGGKPESKVREMYLWVMNSFKVAMQQFSPKSKLTWQVLMRQQRFVEELLSLVTKLNRETSGRLRKIEKLQELISDHVPCLTDFEQLPLPLDPSVLVCGLLPEGASLFKSALEPCKLTFRTILGPEYIAIFKYGDDLRQDQLILQIITLMNELLLKENMDLKLTPYKVLATSCKHGFVQYVDSCSIAEILRTDGSIQNFLRAHAPCKQAPYGISPQVMDTYIRSCAGYCVITYILGIGDRHFDNLLLTYKGHLFHIDFGYILGRDPKPLPPPMKLTKEMIEGMGGQTCDAYLNFRRLCYTTFMQLRRHSSLVLNLFSMMVDASVPDIVLEPDRATQKVEEKFCLAMSEEEAISHFQEIIDASVGAMFAAVVEHFHRFAQYMRK